MRLYLHNFLIICEKKNEFLKNVKVHPIKIVNKTKHKNKRFK